MQFANVSRNEVRRLVTALEQHRNSVKLAVIVLTLIMAGLAISNVVSQFESDIKTDGIRWVYSHGQLIADVVSAGSAGSIADIEPGDVLRTINFRPVLLPQDLGRIINDPQNAARPLQYEITRGTETFVKLLIPQEKSSRFYFYLAFVGFVILGIGLFAFLKSRSRSFALHFYFLCLAFFGAYAFSPTGKLDTLDWIFYWCDELFLLVLAPVFLHFALHFPEKRSWFPRDKAIYLYVPSAVFLAAKIAVTLIYYFVRQTTVIATVEGYLAFENIELSYLFLGLFAGVIVLFLSYARAEDIIHKKQLKMVLAGILAGFGPFCFLWLISLGVRLPQQALEFALVTQILIPLSLAYALLRYRLMDVDIIIKRGMIYTVTTLVLFVMYLLLTVSWLRWILPEASRANITAIASLTTLLAVMLFQPLRDRVRIWVDKFYYRDSYDYRRTLVRFSREITSSIDLEQMVAATLNHIRSTFKVDRADLLLKVGLNTFESFIEKEKRVHPGIALLTRLSKEHSVFIDSFFSPDDDLRDDEDMLRDLNFHYFIPCKFQQNIVAILALTKREKGDYLSSEDLDLLLTLANQLAIVIENHHLFFSLKNKADELERLKNFNENILLSLNVGIITLDENGKVVACNHWIESMLGTNRVSILGRSLQELFPAEIVDRYTNYSMKSARKKLEGARFYKTLVENFQHKETVFNLSFVPLINESDIEYGTILILDDVTHQAKLEEQLTQSEKLSALGLLAAGVAHEVNTPLTGISSYTQMLHQQMNKDQDTMDILQKIEQQTFRASKIINTLLDLSRQQPQPFSPIEINSLLEETLVLLKPHFKDLPIEIVQELDPTNPVILGNDGKLQQVFTNLLLNAKEAMQKGGRLLARTETEGDSVIINIVDTGEGIPENDLKRIYEPFFTRKKGTEAKGTGLGLAITYTIIQEHRGTIDVFSEEKKGTHFQIRLPKVKREVHDQTRAYSGD
jgi:two-component system NtrC family sensor kinase